jgi:hypothetical protein
MSGDIESLLVKLSQDASLDSPCVVLTARNMHGGGGVYSFPTANDPSAKAKASATIDSLRFAFDGAEGLDPVSDEITISASVTLGRGGGREIWGLRKFVIDPPLAAVLSLSASQAAASAAIASAFVRRAKSALNSLGLLSVTFVPCHASNISAEPRF